VCVNRKPHNSSRWCADSECRRRADARQRATVRSRAALEEQTGPTLASRMPQRLANCMLVPGTTSCGPTHMRTHRKTTRLPSAIGRIARATGSSARAHRCLSPPRCAPGASRS
jgi:hypothetical protein